MVSLGTSKTIDLVWQDNLLSKLSRSDSIRLQYRGCHVSSESEPSPSQLFPVNGEVPQGSIVTPTPFPLTLFAYFSMVPRSIALLSNLLLTKPLPTSISILLFSFQHLLPASDEYLMELYQQCVSRFFQNFSSLYSTQTSSLFFPVAVWLEFV